MAASTFAKLAQQPKALRAAAVCAIGALASFFLYSAYLSHGYIRSASITNHDEVTGPARVAKVSMLYGNTSWEYTDCLALHEQHAARHGYPMHVLSNTVAEAYWNKPSYLISLLVQELTKNPEDRIEWFMWVDADSVIMNPLLPVEIFLPPKDFDDINMLVTRDLGGLNSGIFFIRVHKMSVRLVARSLTYPMFFPDEDLGPCKDQWTMALTINETEFRHHVLWQPRTWYNTNIFDDQVNGTLLMHFPGLYDREDSMQWYLNRTAGGPMQEEGTEWIRELADTPYPQYLEEFWHWNRKCRRMVEVAEEAVNKTESVSEELRKATEWLKEVCWYSNDQYEKINSAILNVEEWLNIEPISSPNGEFSEKKPSRPTLEDDKLEDEKAADEN